MLKRIVEYIKWFLGFVAAVTFVAGLAVSNYKAKEQREEMIKNDSVLLREVRDINTALSIQSDNIASIKSTVNTQGRDIIIIRNSFTKHLNTEQMYKDLFEFQRELLDNIKKNNGNNLFPIVSTQPE